MLALPGAQIWLLVRHPYGYLTGLELVVHNHNG